MKILWSITSSTILYHLASNVLFASSSAGNSPLIGAVATIPISKGVWPGAQSGGVTGVGSTELVILVCNWLWGPESDPVRWVLTPIIHGYQENFNMGRSFLSSCMRWRSGSELIIQAIMAIWTMATAWIKARSSLTAFRNVKSFTGQTQQHMNIYMARNSLSQDSSRGCYSSTYFLVQLEATRFSAMDSFLVDGATEARCWNLGHGGLESYRGRRPGASYWMVRGWYPQP